MGDAEIDAEGARQQRQRALEETEFSGASDTHSEDPEPPPPDGEVWAALRRAEQAAAPPPNISATDLAARVERRAESERLLAEAQRAREWDKVEEMQERIVQETLPHEISAHFADIDQYGRVGFNLNFFDPSGRAKTADDVTDSGRPVGVALGGVLPNTQASTHPALEQGMIVTHIEGEPLAGLTFDDVQDIWMGARRFIMVREDEAQRRKLGTPPPQAEMSSARYATMGRLIELHGEHVPPDSREAVARVVAAKQLEAMSLSAGACDVHGRQSSLGLGATGGEELWDEAVEQARGMVDAFPDWAESHYQFG
jgi:hypothetical protein